MIHLAWLVPALPLLGMILNIFIGRRLGRRGVGWLASFAVGAAFLVTVGLYLSLRGLAPESRHIELNLFTWIVAGSFHVPVSLLIDPLSVLMGLVVSGVGFLIHVYSIGYMEHDKDYRRFFIYLNLFVASMLVLVLANNFLLLYVGWELVGLCSYLLIGFWYEKKSAADAGKKAFLTTRIGDVGFALGILLIFATFGTLGYSAVFTQAPKLLTVGGTTATMITLLLFIGAVGKSAQIPLYVWLPDAMEGPTPVSALIHAATMVTAGVFMVARTHVLFELAPFSQAVVATIGTLTAFYAATIALTQMDIKRVLAYSTISQLGYMFLGVGVAAYAAGIFHLMTHAFFKALLFMGAGSVMHALDGETDMRRMGGLIRYMPITGWTFVVAWMAISGIPPFSGFFSKDEILAAAYHNGHPLLWFVGWVTAGLTSFYIGRQVFLTFFGRSRVDPEKEAHLHESPAVMTWPLIALALLAAVGGFVGWPGAHGSPLQGFLEPSFGHQLETGFDSLLALLSTFVGLLGIFVAWLMYASGAVSPSRLTARVRPLYNLLWNKYYVDELYGFLFVRPFRRTAAFLADFFDPWVIDGAVNGVGMLTDAAGRLIRLWESGYVRNYALSLLAGAIVVLAYFVWR
jgi:NADH-quinone oxidoreductase subunit L